MHTLHLHDIFLIVIQFNREIYNGDKRKYRTCIDKLNCDLKKLKEELELGQSSKKRLQRSHSKLNNERKSLMSKLVFIIKYKYIYMYIYIYIYLLCCKFDILKY